MCFTFLPLVVKETEKKNISAVLYVGEWEIIVSSFLFLENPLEKLTIAELELEEEGRCLVHLGLEEEGRCLDHTPGKLDHLHKFQQTLRPFGPQQLIPPIRRAL
mmetsp:Transcript_27549/g.39447  ORF Transcript_27549/g.39447 Transcript_27549/m.39447 type:complete len:104 (+) Transcript_27549:67-378(+)